MGFKIIHFSSTTYGRAHANSLAEVVDIITRLRRDGSTIRAVLEEPVEPHLEAVSKRLQETLERIHHARQDASGHCDGS
jgi:hypothetical protein